MSQLTLFVNFISAERTNASSGETFRQMLVGFLGSEAGVAYSVGLNTPESREFWTTLVERAGYQPAVNARGEVTGVKPADTLIRVTCEATIGAIRTDGDGNKRAAISITSVPAEGFSLTPRGSGQNTPVPKDPESVLARLFGGQSVSSPEEAF